MAVVTYGKAIREGFSYLLKNHPDVFIIGQGLWSPWYVGSSMTELEKEFGKERVLDSPVSENATTGLAVGASLCGYRPVVVHPRIDFMILATDPIVNQAAKWSHMLGGQAHPAVTVRGIVNRGGEQGAQHSQALHSWYAHIPGLKVVMPSTTQDARDLMIASVLSDDPVLYIDDRWLYDLEDDLPEASPVDLNCIGPRRDVEGSDITLVASSYSTEICRLAAKELETQGVQAEIIDLRLLNPLNYDLIVESVQKTGRLIAVDGSWENCGLAGEIIAGVTERVSHTTWRAAAQRITLPSAPAPTSKALEDIFYPKPQDVVKMVLNMVKER